MGNGEEVAKLWIERYVYGMRDRLSAGSEKGRGQERIIVGMGKGLNASYQEQLHENCWQK